jgi:LacI family transcriptional regulator
MAAQSKRRNVDEIAALRYMRQEEGARPPTVYDVARESGVSFSTAAAALRGSSIVKPATRDRVLSVARSIGYRTDASASALASKRLRPHSTALPPVAYVTATGDRHLAPQVNQTWEGIRATAAELGYAAEHVDFRAHPNPAALVRELVARGVGGLLVGRTTPLAYEFPFDWSLFSVVGCNRFQTRWPFHSVRKSVFGSLRDLVSNLHARGYRRIGAALCAHTPPILDDHARLGGLLSAQQTFGPDGARLPPFLGDFEDAKGFLKWFRRARPDVVIGFSSLHLRSIREAGVAVPGDVAFVSLHVWKANPEDRLIAGLVDPLYEVGVRAMELLDQQIRYRKKGLPPTPFEIVVRCPFLEGDTLPARK